MTYGELLYNSIKNEIPLMDRESLKKYARYQNSKFEELFGCKFDNLDILNKEVGTH
jgi:hypothetical protein